MKSLNEPNNNRALILFLNSSDDLLPHPGKFVMKCNAENLSAVVDPLTRFALADLLFVAAQL